MQNALLEDANPPMWWIEGGRDGTAKRFVRFGHQQIAVADILSMNLEEVRETQSTGLFLMGTVFMCLSAALAYYVFEIGARERFLIGTVFLGGLGMTGMVEASRLRGLRHYELTFALKGGRRAVFSSADRADIQSLALRLAVEGAVCA